MTPIQFVILLPVLLLSISASIAAENNPPAGTWVVDPTNQGPNIPPVGHSLFDYIVTSRKNGKLEYDVPFPYEKLIEKIERYVEHDNNNYSPVKQVLIPMGRSLARNIARPDFFRLPRVVAAVDTHPVADKTSSGILLKDRLYIGFGEKANILEVISYNEAAGRFEFQIVKDYKKGGTPKVYYTSREVCSACHQNGALIFSRQQWDETNANPKVATLLKMENKDFYGVPIERGVDIPNAIDNATDRANLFALTQLLWQTGCNNQQNSSDTESAIKCRTNILRFALQYALSGFAYFDSLSDRYSKEFIPYFKANWHGAWPSGLLIPDPDIPNRDPLLMFANIETLPTVGGKFTAESRKILDDMLSQTDIPAAFEPLNQREPMQRWRGDTPQQLNSIIKGISDFIAESDIKRLDTHIFSTVLKTKQNSQIEHNSTCSVESDSTNDVRTRIRFSCNNFVDSAAISPIKVIGRFYIENNELIEGFVSELNINNQYTYRNLPISKTSVEHKQSTKKAALFINYLGRHIRLPNGNGIQSIQLTWSDDQNSAMISINEINDFSFIENAINMIADETIKQQTDVLADKPFRRAIVIASLFDKLKMQKLEWCCVDDTDMPPIVLDSDDESADTQIVLQDVDGEIAPFYRYCSQCHRTTNNAPPNFLHGDKLKVESNIAHCSERIFFRLSMWHVEKPQQTKTPMPPETALPGIGFMRESWMRSAELSSMKHYVRKLIQKQSGLEPDINTFIQRGFNNLRSCLP